VLPRSLCLALLLVAPRLPLLSVAVFDIEGIHGRRRGRRRRRREV